MDCPILCIQAEYCEKCNRRICYRTDNHCIGLLHIYRKKKYCGSCIVEQEAEDGMLDVRKKKTD